ncbi:HD domain-containing protein [Streptomyces pakalii]|uniref:Caspase family protein n=1 Tax=Streptomyces pakalii TaxID=3036494 RepID=A0ABT7DIX3_9ACTN|nr:caspase family protein [Streptomyces pakalii]MDJ1644867.1 caspase family protein [Streptomyces pakalii]
MEEIRRALLIGVPTTPEALSHFAPLNEPVQADLHALRSTLEASGYDVEILSGAGRAAIGARIFEVSQEIPEEGTLLLYFTGHGLRLGEVDYLVPSDARAPADGIWQQPYLDSLLPADISPYLARCRAGTVLWIVDACRDTSRAGNAAFGTGVLHGSPSGRFALMLGCSPGQQCGFTSEGSFFTESLVQAMGPMTAPQTVHEVYASVRAHTLRASLRHGKAQEVQIRYAPDREEETRSARICTGRHLLDDWRRAVIDEDLWKLIAPEHAAGEERAKECLLALVDACARRVHRSQQALPDPWADDGFPVRVLRIGLLPLLTEGDRSDLTAVELAGLIAAPFLREAAWADRLAQAAEASPLRADAIPNAGPVRRHLEQVYGNYPHIRRKLVQCHVQGRESDQAAVALWLVHRWAAERFEEDADPVPLDLADAFAAELLGSDTSTDNDLMDQLSTAVRWLAADVGPDDPGAYGPENVLSQIRLPEGRQHFRTRPLSALLRLAGILAVDVRTFPDVIADHLAIADPVLPTELVGVLQRSLDWVPEDDCIHLDLRCSHQAIHAGLAEVVDRADRTASALRELSRALPVNEQKLLSRLPARVTDRNLRPRQTSGRVDYEVPLLRFHLAQTEVRDLLMGRQLYGDPLLAVRELYQNAMDACRYRTMRWRYLRGKGHEPMEWSAAITLHQGTDDRGRYIECRDNGVGMGIEQLKGTFTRAGSRFEQSRAFRREQAAWLRQDAGLQLHPNSRFGIGVLSYFMIADEMTIVTRQVHPDGTVARQALRVEIPSSGSLFRIQPQPDEGEDTLAGGGTRVRLYLREDSDLPRISCVDIMRSLVKVSEHRLEVTEPDNEEAWTPGVLRLAAKQAGNWQEAVPGVLWWVNGTGAILCDGIVTDQEPYGYVLNLTGIHAGTLSVNRNELLGYDEDWATDIWQRSADSLVGWQGLTMRWLWKMEEESFQVAQVVHDALRGRGLKIPLTDGEDAPQCALDDIGWCHLDKEILSTQSSHGPPIFDLWRIAALRAQGVALGSRARSAVTLMHHPVPEVGDADLVHNVSGGWPALVIRANATSSTVAHSVRALRRLRALSAELAPPAVRHGDLGWVPEPLDETVARALSGAWRPDNRTRKWQGKPDFGGLIKASYLTGKPLGQLIEHCKKLAPFGVEPPQVPPHHEGYVCTADDLDLLHVNGNPEQSPLRPNISRLTLWSMSKRLGVPAAETAARLQEFAWLGWSVPSLPSSEEWGWLTDDIVAHVGSFRRMGKGGREYIDWLTTVAAIASLEIGLRQAEEDIPRAAAALGMDYLPKPGDVTTSDSYTPSSDLSEFLSGLSANFPTSLDLQDLYFSHLSDLDFDGQQSLLRELRQIGFNVPADIRILFGFNDLPLTTQITLSGLDPLANEYLHPAPTPNSAILFSASVHLNLSMEEVWALAEAEAERFSLDVPALPPSLRSWRPTNAEAAVLIAGGSDNTPSWKQVTPHHLAQFARGSGMDVRTAYAYFEPLRALGAQLPDLTPAELEGLPTTVPDEYDLLVLSGELRCSSKFASFTALDLLSIATGVGRAADEVWRRMAPYRPFVTIDEISSVPAVVPTWQDLAILSIGLNGLPPALTGAVTGEQIRFAAQEVAESEEWVRERLTVYAEMFEITLPELVSPAGRGPRRA